MAFLKLDTGILDSTLWLDSDATKVFVTALCLAQPHDFANPVQQLEVRANKPTKFSAPPGWYGFIPMAGVGIVDRAKLHSFGKRTIEQARAAGMRALERLGAPDPESRTPDHDGRRLIRVAGGFLVLNYRLYRDKDHAADSNATRQKRFRDRQKQLDTVTDSLLPSQGVTDPVSNASLYVDVDVEEEKKKGLPSGNPNTPVPVKAVVKAFNDTMTKLPKVLVINPARIKSVRTAWQADRRRQSVEFWAAYFEECQLNDFLNGTGPYGNGHENWQPDFDFLMREKVIVRVYERAMQRKEKRRAAAAEGARP